MNSPKLDGGGDLSKQEQIRPSKRNNPQKTKADPSALENQTATAQEHTTGLKQGLAPDVAEERTKVRPEDTMHSLGREKEAIKKDRVESWLQKTSPGGQPAPAIKANKDGKVRWLRDADLLPSDLKKARILSFHYSTPLDEGKPPSLAVLAEEFRSHLSRVRENCKNRPIIFIAHDFGVTIIEKTLMECAKDQTLVVDICKVTLGVLFFMTPTEKTSKGDQEVPYFEPRDTRLPPEGKVRYVEVQDANFLDDHLRNFENFTDWLSGLRPAMALHSIQSDGKIAVKDVDAYRKTLSLITGLLKAYPLLDAVDEGDEDRVKAILKLEPEPDLQDFAGQSALHIAVRKNRTQVVRLLLSNGANVSLQNKEGMSALHFAVTSNPKTGAIMEMLLDEGADVDALNIAGDSVLDLADRAGVNPASLKNQRLIKGPSEDISDRRREPVPPTISSAVAACSELQATLAEFYLIDRQEQLMIQRPNVYELLYERGPDEIMAAARKREVSEDLKPRCKWYHLPANHIGWVNDLFARMNIVPDSTQEDEHHGTTAWSRYMRPKARTFKPVQYFEDTTGTWHSTECAGKNFVLYIPFLNFERNCDMLEVYKIQDRRGEFVQELFAPAKRDAIEHSPRVIVPDSDDDDSNSGSNAPPSGTSLHSGITDGVNAGRMPTWSGGISGTWAWYRKRRSTSSASSDNDPLDIEKKLLRGHLWSEERRKPGELHVRRTLDQSHYFMLDDTSERDWDQVVLREARRPPPRRGGIRAKRRRRYVSDSGTSSDTEMDESEEYPLVIVDQLWIWVVGDTVVTSFPQKFRQPDWQFNCDIAEQLRQHLQTDKKRAPVTSAHDLASLIIAYCVSVFNRTQPRETGLRLHDSFETSVGVVADTEMRLFRKFEAASKEDPNMILEKLKKKAKKTKNKKKEHGKRVRVYVETEDDDDDLFDIRKEIKLLDEVKDIRDELRMILRILNDQALAVGDVAVILQLDSTNANLDPSSPPAPEKTDTEPQNASDEPVEGVDKPVERVDKPVEGVDDLTSPATVASSSQDARPPSVEQPDQPHQIITTFTEGAAKAPTRSDVVTTSYKQRHPVIDANIRDFERMLSHANASYEALNHLLDLKQKQANALEARLARIGAEASNKQSNTIMVFTVATIVFGSLSFVAAFFALNVTAFPKQADGTTTAWNLGHLVGYVAGISIGLSLPFIAIAFSINPLVETAWSREKRLQDNRPRSKWSKARDKAFNVLIASWLYRLPYFRRRKKTDYSSYYSSYTSSSSESYSRIIALKRSLPRRMLQSLAAVFAALWILLRSAAVKMKLVSARKRNGSTSYASTSVIVERVPRRRVYV